MDVKITPDFCSLCFVQKVSFCIFSEEKKVKKYLEDNYQHRTDLISPIPELKTNGDVPAESKKYQGTGPKTKEGKE